MLVLCQYYVSNMSVLCQYIETNIYTNLLNFRYLYQILCRMSVDLQKIASYFNCFPL